MYKTIPIDWSHSFSSKKEHEKWPENRTREYKRHVFWDKKTQTQSTKRHAITIHNDGIAEADYNVCLYHPILDEKAGRAEALYISPKFPDIDYIRILELAFLHYDEDPTIKKKLSQICEYASPDSKNTTYLIPIHEAQEPIFLPFLLAKWILEARWHISEYGLDYSTLKTIKAIDSVLDHIPNKDRISSLLEKATGRTSEERMADIREGRHVSLLLKQSKDESFFKAGQNNEIILNHYDEANRRWHLPPFWISMPYLMELYVLHLFRTSSPPKNYLYQQHFPALKREVIPDCILPAEHCVADVKYKTADRIDNQDMARMAHYSILEGIREAVGVPTGTFAKCVFIYPDPNGNSLLPADIFDGAEPIGGYSNIRRLQVMLPSFPKL